MSQTLTQIAQELIATNKKVQLIYAFNGTGKTRLSREFKELIALKTLMILAVPSLNHHGIKYFITMLIPKICFIGIMI